jgi:rhamnosyltransferase
MAPPPDRLPDLTTGESPLAPLSGQTATCAVFVSYHPDPSFLSNIRAVVPQVGATIIVDNGSTGAAADIVARAAELPKVRVIHCGENLGLGAALNIGVAEARSRGCEWIVTFDQDSSAPAGYVDELISAINSYERRERVAVVGPVYVDQGTGLRTSFARSSAGNIARVETTLTSGSLVRASVFDVVGPFDEGFFIDYLDIEFCLRCAMHGYDVIQASAARLGHNLGRSVVRRVLWKKFGVTNHSALRRYYIARNRLAVYRRYASRRPGWVIRDVYSFVREVAKFLCFEDDRRAKAAATLRGVRDGIRGVTGPHE